MSLFLVAILFLAVAMLLLSVGVILKKNGRFPNTHVGSNAAMRERGIGCHTSQHREAQRHRTLADRVGQA